MMLPAELWPLLWTRETGRAWPPCGAREADRLFAAANDQGLIPLLMASDDLPAVVEAAKSRHRAWHAIYRKRDELSRAALPELARLIGTEAFTCFKGSDFRHRLYPDPALRPMDDIDVLVARARFEPLLARLSNLGFDRKRGAHGTPFSPDHHEASVMIGEVHVEIHRSFVQPIRNWIDYDALLARREAFDADGLTLWRFSRADAIVAQAFELAKDEFQAKLIRHVDFHLLIQGHDDLLPLCVARAKSWQVERALFCALELHRRLFPSRASSAVTGAIDQLLTPRTRARLAGTLLTRAGRPQTRARRVAAKLALIDSPWRRCALPVVAAWQEAKGRLYERRARRAGMRLPPRAKISLSRGAG